MVYMMLLRNIWTKHTNNLGYRPVSISTDQSTCTLILQSVRGKHVLLVGQASKILRHTALFAVHSSHPMVPSCPVLVMQD